MKHFIRQFIVTGLTVGLLSGGLLSGCLVRTGHSDHSSRNRCGPGKVLVHHKGKSKCKKAKKRKHDDRGKHKGHDKH